MKDPMLDKDNADRSGWDELKARNETTELAHEEYKEALEELGIPTEGIEDFEPHLTLESTIEIASSFESMILRIDDAQSFGELREMHQELNPPRHARSPKRHLQHKRAVERRKKRKNGGKK